MLIYQQNKVLNNEKKQFQFFSLNIAITRKKINKKICFLEATFYE